MYLKISSAKWRPFCSGWDELIWNGRVPAEQNFRNYFFQTKPRVAPWTVFLSGKFQEAWRCHPLGMWRTAPTGPEEVICMLIRGARWSGVPPMASFLTLLKSMWSCAIKFAPICLCFSSLCYLSSPCKLIVYCYEHIVCFDSAQFDALLDNFECIYCICPSAVFCINNSILFYSILFHHFSQLGLGCLLHFINTSRESKMTSWPRNPFRINGPLWGESAYHQWIHFIKASTVCPDKCLTNGIESRCFHWCQHGMSCRTDSRLGGELRHSEAHLTPL